LSGLAAVLAGRHEPGVFRWHAAFPPDQVAHTVEHAGWKFALLDAWPTDTKEEFLERIAKALGFPDQFGGNLAALADRLNDLDVGDHGLVLLWEGWGPFAHKDEAAFTQALEVLGNRAGDQSRGKFVALLRGDGPDDVDIPSLD
jgi:RNAse (barnase) inhibitor barstar